MDLLLTLWFLALGSHLLCVSGISHLGFWTTFGLAFCLRAIIARLIYFARSGR